MEAFIVDVLLSSLEHGEQSALVLVTVATLSFVLLAGERVVDVDGTTAKESTLHGEHGIARRTKIVVGDEGDTALVDHVEEGLDLAELLELLLDELSVGLELDASDEEGTTGLFVVIKAPAATAETASSSASATTSATTTAATSEAIVEGRSRSAEGVLWWTAGTEATVALISEAT